MTVVATIDLPADEFLLSDVISSHPEIGIEFDPVISIGSTRVSCIWVSGASIDEVDHAFRVAADVDSVEFWETTNGKALARVEWNGELPQFAEVLTANGAAVPAVACRSGTWTLQLRFADDDALSTFYRQCAERNIAFDIRSVSHSQTVVGGRTDPVLTDAQYETLQVAIDEGYFAIPRRITLQELAAELGVSDTAASQRLRRGLTTLLTATFPFSGRDAESSSSRKLQSQEGE